MTTPTRQSIDVDLPVRTVYDQWTQFEEFPRFMEGVREVRQLDDRHVHWVARIMGVEREWDAEIVEQEPDRRIAWRAIRGVENSGAVTFDRLDDAHTRVTLELDFEPEGFVEKIGDRTDLVERRVHGDLERFKSYLESRGRETGEWRGTIGGEAGGANSFP